MGLLITVLIAAFLPFAVVGICLLSDICSDLPITTGYYQRMFIFLEVACSFALVVLFLFRALDQSQVHRTALKSESRADGTNVCNQVYSN